MDTNQPSMTKKPANTVLMMVAVAIVAVAVAAVVVVLVTALDLAPFADSEAANSTSNPYADAQILMGSSHLTVDENRQTFLVRDGFSRINTIATLDVSVSLQADDGQYVVWSGTAQPFADADGTYWVAYPAFTVPGHYLFDVTVTTTDHVRFTRQLQSEVYAEPVGVGVGAVAPAVSSFTLDMDDRPARITTDLTPNDAFYQLTVAEAVTSGRPSVVVFGTPELCTRKLWNLCGATLDVFDALVVEYDGAVNFVHVEIYNLDTGKYVEAWNRYGLEVSPWIYVIDSAGVVNYRYDAIVGAEELRPRLERLLSAAHDA